MLRLLASPPPHEPRFLIEELLAQQRELTAVEQFAQYHAEHDAAAAPLQAKFYRDLIPLTSPQPGQQYAFEVDLDACSGCKACVTACHELNGLDEDETWRSVGLLRGGSTQLPVVQHVTTACHHCLDPACLYGCPVAAYEKDPVTGIVKHLDDQCIGCQYCIFKCPYDVPKYNHAKGIVRKCDMCSGRLAAGEAPACVQACPNRAIRIALVDTNQVIEDSEANLFLPGTPEPHYTLPSTSYKTNRVLPRNLLPADYYAVAPGHSHWALVLMLVLTQMSVGAFVVGCAIDALVDSQVLSAIRPMRALGALFLGLLGMGAAVGHLGRPLYAFRALLGLRTSWLSREILAFGLFAIFAALYGISGWLDAGHAVVAAGFANVLQVYAAGCGIGGVFCSVMVYVDTRRPFWNGPFTLVKFFLTSVVLGIPAAVLIALVSASSSESLSCDVVIRQFGAPLWISLMAATAAKLVCECAIFTHLRDKKQTPLKRTALLMAGELRRSTVQRFIAGTVGGLLLPAVLIVRHAPADGAGSSPAIVGALVSLTLLVLLAGELLERFLFFSASVAPKMPGSLVT